MEELARQAKAFFTSIISVMQVLTNRGVWVRVGTFVLGALLLMGGVWILVGQRLAVQATKAAKVIA